MFSALSAETSYQRLLKTLDSYLNFALDHPKYYQLIFASEARKQIHQVVTKNKKNDLSRSFVFFVDRVRESLPGSINSTQLVSISASIWSHAHGLILLHQAGHLGPQFTTKKTFTSFFKNSIEAHISAYLPK